MNQTYLLVKKKYQLVSDSQVVDFLLKIYGTVWMRISENCIVMIFKMTCLIKDLNDMFSVENVEGKV